ncbi:hypothetical protein HMPREF1872_01124 [Amygdalobacter nucleatus]|uniref:Uncharacterized protein n=1 Tax=Amygdalobacter nucleatus TaxID=3029274 RepID=A0A133Y8M0_9FIRM|nr:hypothetical protein HMPREF1872_01124 [Amygdalobacter nucleatus]
MVIGDRLLQLKVASKVGLMRILDRKRSKVQRRSINENGK